MADAAALGKCRTASACIMTSAPLVQPGSSTRHYAYSNIVATSSPMTFRADASKPLLRDELNLNCTSPSRMRFWYTASLHRRRCRTEKRTHGNYLKEWRVFHFSIIRPTVGYRREPHMKGREVAFRRSSPQSGWKLDLLPTRLQKASTLLLLFVLWRSFWRTLKPKLNALHSLIFSSGREILPHGHQNESVRYLVKVAFRNLCDNIRCAARADCF